MSKVLLVIAAAPLACMFLSLRIAMGQPCKGKDYKPIEMPPSEPPGELFGEIELDYRHRRDNEILVKCREDGRIDRVKAELTLKGGFRVCGYDETKYNVWSKNRKAEIITKYRRMWSDAKLYCEKQAAKPSSNSGGAAVAAAKRKCPVLSFEDFAFAKAGLAGRT